MTKAFHEQSMGIPGWQIHLINNNSIVKRPIGLIPCRVGLIASFRNGKPEGEAWQTLIGGGMLYGRLHPDSSDFTGRTVFSP